MKEEWQDWRQKPVWAVTPQILDQGGVLNKRSGDSGTLLRAIPLPIHEDLEADHASTHLASAGQSRLASHPPDGREEGVRKEGPECWSIQA